MKKSEPQRCQMAEWGKKMSVPWQLRHLRPMQPTGHPDWIGGCWPSNYVLCRWRCIPSGGYPTTIHQKIKKLVNSCGIFQEFSQTITSKDNFLKKNLKLTLMLVSADPVARKSPYGWKSRDRMPDRWPVSVRTMRAASRSQTLTAPAALPAQTNSSVGENRTASTAVVWPLKLCKQNKWINSSFDFKARPRGPTRNPPLDQGRSGKSLSFIWITLTYFFTQQILNKA